MTYTKVADITAEIVSRLEGIRVANGAETDLGARIYHGRRQVDESSVPCLVLVEADDTPQSRAGRTPSAEITQPYAIAAYLPCDPNNPNVAANAAIRDIKRAIFKPEAGSGGRGLRPDYRGRAIGPRADGVAIVFAQVDIAVTYVEDLTNP